MSAPRYASDSLAALARGLLARAGVRADIAEDTAAVLVEGDLLGHTTHGLALLPLYLGELEKGGMAKDGAPRVLSQRPAAQTWDGQRLPGPWLTLRALDAACAMADSQGTGTVVIRRSHHIACLEAFLRRATDRGYLVVLQSSDPWGASVAPFNAVSGVYTPNPLAAGIPTGGDPILLDISCSYTTNSLVARLHQQGGRLPHPWLQDSQGNPTDDPGVMFREPKGTLLPLGGLDAGHKGFALALLVESMTGGLAGYGRADPLEGWGATVFLQVLDPDAFGGRENFLRQTSHLADACRAATPRPGTSGVRMPGQRGLALMREQQARGVELYPTIVPSLEPWCAKLGVAFPAPLSA